MKHEWCAFCGEEIADSVDDNPGCPCTAPVPDLFLDEEVDSEEE